MIKAGIILDSINTSGNRLTTFELQYPWRIHEELLTHRTFSRSSASSRAIPAKTMIDDVLHNPAEVKDWRLNQSGMQGYTKANEHQAAVFNMIQQDALYDAVKHARRLSEAGAHKQHVNAMLKPFAHIRTVVSATEFKNFWRLRIHEKAHPEICALAAAMKELYDSSQPKELLVGEWHIPYTDRGVPEDATLYDLQRIGVARCARVSYRSFGKDNPYSDSSDDVRLFDGLVVDQPPHSAPTEHVATPMSSPIRMGNFVGWLQLRKTVSGENGGDYEQQLLRSTGRATPEQLHFWSGNLSV